MARVPMSLAGKRPHGDPGAHPESPEQKRYLSDGLAALRIAPARPHPRAPTPLAPTPFGGAPLAAADSAFLQGGAAAAAPPAAPQSRDLFGLCALSSRLEERAEAPPSPPPPPEEGEGGDAPGVESRALILYREPPRARVAPGLRRAPVVSMAVDGSGPWFGRSPPRHQQHYQHPHQHVAGKRRLLAMVPYRPAKRRLLLGTSSEENDFSPPPPTVVHLGWDAHGDEAESADSATMEIDCSEDLSGGMHQP